jgi:hypothetical protein
MATGKINPAFEAAPFLGESSFNPNEFMRRQNMQKFQLEKHKQDEEAANTAKGLENLMVDVKGWEDQQGFKEIMSDQNRVMNGFLDLSKKGLDLVSPKTTQEILAYKAINDAHAQIKQKVDTWNQQKGIYDLYTKAIEKDAILPPEEQEIDHAATIANVQKVLNTKDIMGRGTDLQNLVVTKTKPVDVFKDVIANKDIFEKGTQSQNVVDMPDGSKQISMVENLTPQQTEANAKKAGQLFDSKPQSYKDAVKKIREADPEPKLNVMTDKDYYKTIAVPTYRKKFLDKPTGSGSGMSMNFGGSKVQVTPGELQTNDNMIGGRNYSQRYDFQTKGQLVKVPTTGGYQHDSDPKAGDDGWHEITGGDYAEAELLFYDPKDDQLVFRTGQAAKNPWIDNNITFSVPRKNVPDAEKLPITVDGKRKTLKDVLPAADATPVLRTIGGKDFRATTPYIPKKK